jgi:hypothetical protein
VDQSEIYDLKPFVRATQWEKDSQNHKVPWSRVKQVRVDADSPNIIKFKLNLLEDDYKELHLCHDKTVVTRKRKSNSKKSIEVPSSLMPAYNGPMPIGHEKSVDLKELCKQGIIPRVYHPFYESLNPAEVVFDEDDDIDEFFI